MNFRQMEERTARKLGARLEYKYCYYIEFDYSILNSILSRKKNGSRSDTTYSECYIAFDTETSKKHEPQKTYFGRYVPQENHICAWTISIRAFHRNICTLRGSRPSEIVHCLKLIRENISASVLYIFVHNLSYDWTFCRRFFMKEFGQPVKQLNVNNHKPLTIKFKNGIVLRDSLILAGMSLETWSKILMIGEHEKAVGFWNYDKIRNQNESLSPEELIYIEYDCLALVECLNKLADMLGDTVVSLPFTNTGIPRRTTRKEGRKNYAKLLFNKIVGDYQEFQNLDKVFHGGFVHSNRYKNGVISLDVTGRDFKSSYPFSLLVTKMPRGAFVKLSRNFDISELISKSEDTAFMFKFIAEDIHLKNNRFPMPPLQLSKCEHVINPVKDNGRILRADYVEIWLNEYDAMLINEYYDWSGAICVEVHAAFKDYLPRWFRDVIFNTFKEKCELEYQIKTEGNTDLKPAYAQCKSRLNSLYGMCVTKPVKEQIIESYEDTERFKSGDYYYDSQNMEKDYEKYLKNRNEILPYCWGVWCTSESMYRIFQLAKCIGDGDKDLTFHWIYTDTDSVYSDKWNEDKLIEFNNDIKNRLIEAGYGAVTIRQKEYWLGVAEFDGTHDRFISQGAKRYCYEDNGVISITVAGVPKCGSKCLNSLEDFKEGFIFKGIETGKKLLTYIYNDIYIDENGNETADSIDLSPCDYRLSCEENPLRLDQIIIFNDDGTLSINEFDEPSYDWFE